MKELPILFAGDMVRAILDGSKTQTRRPIKGENVPNPGHDCAECLCREIDPSDTPCLTCEGRYGAAPWKVGNRLWVKETWQVVTGRTKGDLGAAVRYKDMDLRACTMPAAKPMPLGLTWDRWRPSIHMPRWASRLDLLVTSVRAERVQDITDDDALREGIHPLAYEAYESPRMGFRELWERTYPGSWDRNDAVWVIDFQQVDR